VLAGSRALKRTGLDALEKLEELLLVHFSRLMVFLAKYEDLCEERNRSVLILKTSVFVDFEVGYLCEEKNIISVDLRAKPLLVGHQSLSLASNHVMSTINLFCLACASGLG